MSNQNGSIVSYETWLAALSSSACIGFTSLVPWLFNLTFFEHRNQGQQKLKGVHNEDSRMKFLLSFAVGAILGDIFFHLIPESLHSYLVELNDSEEVAHRKVGLSIIAGIFMFIIVEMVLEKWSHSVKDDAKSSKDLFLKENSTTKMKQKYEMLKPNDQKQIIFDNNNNSDLKSKTISSNELINQEDSESIDNNNSSTMKNLNSSSTNYVKKLSIIDNSIINSDLIDSSSILLTDQHLKSRQTKQQSILKSTLTKTETLKDSFDQNENKNSINNHENSNKCQIVDVAGYLNLIANGFDNFTHGLAIGASYLVGLKVGLLTTFVIFIHEIPHEICDYAILVNSGFSRWEAVKAQSSVSLFGILGTATALCVKSVQTLTAKTVWILPFSAGGFLYIALVNLLPEILDRESNIQNSSGQVACVIFGIAFMAAVAII